MDINREEMEDCYEEKKEEEEESSTGSGSGSGTSTSKKLWCWETTVGFVTATHAHPRGLFIHPHSWLAALLALTFMHTNA